MWASSITVRHMNNSAANTTHGALASHQPNHERKSPTKMRSVWKTRRSGTTSRRDGFVCSMKRAGHDRRPCQLPGHSLCIHRRFQCSCASTDWHFYGTQRIPLPLIGGTMFSRDINHTQYRVPRTMQTSKFGPYATLSVPSRRRRFAAAFWVVAYGVGIGVAWWLLVAIRVGA